VNCQLQKIDLMFASQMRSIEGLTFKHCLIPSIHKWAGAHCVREGSLEYPGHRHIGIQNVPDNRLR